MRSPAWPSFFHHSRWIHTMFRCDRPLRRALLLLALLSPVLSLVHAQAVRNFPATALRGEMVIGTPPVALLNGSPTQLAPGVRIRDEGNLILLSDMLRGRKLVVNYTTDLYGQPLDVWILTPAERARLPWPRSIAEAAAWRFDFDAQAWFKP
ncbi:MAG: hypothetical protein ABI574_20130 [Burkholderiales bacterium]